jgi:hypothetical protein
MCETLVLPPTAVIPPGLQFSGRMWPHNQQYAQAPTWLVRVRDGTPTGAILASSACMETCAPYSRSACQSTFPPNCPQIGKYPSAVG